MALDAAAGLKGLPARAAAFLAEHKAEISPEQRSVALKYENYATDEVLRRLLPADVAVPTAFETVGHVAHLNLSAEQRKHAALIGEVLLTKNPSLKTVVNKESEIKNQFRVFPMRVIAGVDGEGALVTEVSESGCRFKLDFGEVYWNSRLATEHARLVKLFKKGDLIADCMAGVGPFAVPAASKRGSVVHANDLNPASHKWLVENIALNKCGDKCTPYNEDARQFLRDLVGRGVWPAHVVMNLPASALEFLDVVGDVFRGGEAAGKQPPSVHCYCFTRHAEIADATADVLERAASYMGVKLDADGPEKPVVSLVRDVAPSKYMARLSFVVPPELMRPAEGPPAKKARTEA